MLNALGIKGKDQWNATSPVASFTPNDYGVYDLCGNVWEWCSDVYKKGWLDSLLKADKEKELYLENPAGADYHTMYRVAKGGSWHNEVDQSEISSRENVQNTMRYRNMGFRCVRGVSVVEQDTVSREADAADTTQKDSTDL
jgi:formylglycine-generating enzyme required for sulfatase activity